MTWDKETQKVTSGGSSYGPFILVERKEINKSKGNSLGSNKGIGKNKASGGWIR